MVFSSSIFLYIFLPAVLLAYYVFPGIRMKNLILLGASLFFYAWGEPVYVLLMIFSILMNYGFGLWLDHCHRKGNRGKPILVLAVILNLGILFYFKYYHFAVETAGALLGITFHVKEIALPIGISFYTFQSMSYVVDVYREGTKPTQETIVQKNIIKLALYISLFPQLIAGPIVRYHDIHPRLTAREHTLENFAAGVEIFIIGLAKKVIFANILGNTADGIIAGGLNHISSAQAWLSSLLYMLQIFYDFSGYSEMAIGLGKMFGFDFMKNFDYPYISRSITEFWRRWHISLSSWFRDYLYIPLGGNRSGNVYVNLSLVFLATGIWHGADWSFILWGVWHGLFILIERILRQKDIRFPLPGILKSVLGWIYTMLVVYFGWILFRMGNIRSAATFFQILLGITKPTFVAFDLGWYLDNRTLCVLMLAVLCCIPWKQLIHRTFSASEMVWTHPFFKAAKRVALILLLCLCFLMVISSTYNPFIYFRF